MAIYRIKKGLDLPLAGAPAVDSVEEAPPVKHVAVVAADYIEIRPRMLVQVGDEVKLGQPLCAERKIEGVVHCAPAGGRVAAIHRGAKRALQSIVIEVADGTAGDGTAADGTEAQVELEGYTGARPAELSGTAVRDLLVASGMWTALRMRPFSKVPSTTSTPSAVFVTASDTNPLAPPPEAALKGREDDWEWGLEAVAQLTEGKTYLCSMAGGSVGPAATSNPAGASVSHQQFAGKHPAGTVGVHIHTLLPVHKGRCVWHLGYQAVLAIGHVFRTGRIDTRRVISLGGPGVAKPRLLATRVGASIDELTAGQLKEGELRIISGSVLSGRAASGEVGGYLGRYDNQISVLSEDRERVLLGWLRMGFDKFSVTRAFASALTGGGKKWDLTTTTNGEERAMVPIGLYEKVFPLDILPTFLLRAIAVDDIERAEQLGALELAEEDLALCTFVCPGKTDWGPVLRRNLATMEKEGLCSF